MESDEDNEAVRIFTLLYDSDRAVGSTETSANTFRIYVQFYAPNAKSP